MGERSLSSPTSKGPFTPFGFNPDLLNPLNNHAEPSRPAADTRQFQHPARRRLLSSFGGAPAGRAASSNKPVLSRSEGSLTRLLTHGQGGGTLRPMDLLPLRVAAITSLQSLTPKQFLCSERSWKRRIFARPRTARAVR